MRDPSRGCRKQAAKFTRSIAHAAEHARTPALQLFRQLRAAQQTNEIKGSLPRQLPTNLLCVMEGKPCRLHCHWYELTVLTWHLEPHTTLALLRPHLCMGNAQAGGVCLTSSMSVIVCVRVCMWRAAARHNPVRLKQPAHIRQHPTFHPANLNKTRNQPTNQPTASNQPSKQCQQPTNKPTLSDSCTASLNACGSDGSCEWSIIMPSYLCESKEEEAKGGGEIEH